MIVTGEFRSWALKKTLKNDFFCKMLSDSFESRVKHSCRSFVMRDERSLLTSLFCPEGPEQIAHGLSSVKSHGSNSLTVALLS